MAIFVYPFFPYYKSKYTQRVFHRFVNGMVSEFEACCDYYEGVEKIPFRIYREDPGLCLVPTSKADALSHLKQLCRKVPTHEKIT